MSLREGALALGATRARAVFTVVLPAALPGIMTGIVLALARVAGETAPLLFTAFNNRFWSTSLTQPISSLTVQIYAYAISPYEDWHRQAWAGALVLVMIVLAARCSPGWLPGASNGCTSPLGRGPPAYLLINAPPRAREARGRLSVEPRTTRRTHNAKVISIKLL